MRKVMQGTDDGCAQAAIATILGLPLQAVPNFAEQAGTDVQRYNDMLDNYMDARGFFLFMRPGSIVPPPCTLVLASGPTVRGTQHMVVMRDDELVHDPHESGVGLESVQCYYILVPFDPARTAVDVEPL